MEITHLDVWRVGIGKKPKEFYEEALMLDYSMGLIFGYSGAKFLTPRVPQLKTKKYHLHHWMWASLILTSFVFLKPSDAAIGIFTGVALEGLSYINWGLKRC